MEQTLKGLQRQHMTSVCCQQIQGVLAHTAEEKFSLGWGDTGPMAVEREIWVPPANCELPISRSMASSEQLSRAAANQEEGRGTDKQATGIL